MPCSPTGYRFGFGSPTRLVRFGLAGVTTVSEEVGVDGTFPFNAFCELATSWASSAVFFRRERAGFGATSAAFNLLRLDVFLAEKKVTKTRISCFATLAPVELASWLRVSQRDQISG